MERAFIDILQKLVSEQGKETLFNESKCKSLLADYTKGEYKKESRFLLQAIEAGVPKKIDDAKDLSECKKRQIKLLNEEYILDEKVAADVVNTLAFVLRGDSGLEAQAALDRGNKHYENRDYDKAIAEFIEAIKIDPNFARAYRCRGLAYMRKNQNEQAIKDFDKAIDLDPNFAYVYVNRGLIHSFKGQDEKAFNDFDKAIKLDPNSATAYGGRGDVYVQRRQYTKAIADFDKAISLAPNDEVSYMSRGNAYMADGQTTKAINDFEKVLTMAPDGPNKEFAKSMLRKIRGY